MMFLAANKSENILKDLDSGFPLEDEGFNPAISARYSV